MVSDTSTGAEREAVRVRAAAYFHATAPPPVTDSKGKGARGLYNPPSGYPFYERHPHTGAGPPPPVYPPPPLPRAASGEYDYAPGYDSYPGPYAGPPMRSYSHDSGGPGPISGPGGSPERLFLARSRSGSIEIGARFPAGPHGLPPPVVHPGSAPPYMYGPADTLPPVRGPPYSRDPGPPPPHGPLPIHAGPPPPYDPHQVSGPPRHPSERGGPGQYGPSPPGSSNPYPGGHHMSAELHPSLSWNTTHQTPPRRGPPLPPLHHQGPGLPMASYRSSDPNVPIKTLQRPRAPRQKATSPKQIEAFRRLDVMAAGCTCKKSKCLKLYCFCFGADMYCTTTCRCTTCCNRSAQENMRKEARARIVSRNPLAFSSKFQTKRGGGNVLSFKRTVTQGENLAHKVGCKCRKSSCLKKYCECYNAGVKCSPNCRCVGCQNEGLSGGPNLPPRRAPLLLRPAGERRLALPAKSGGRRREPWMMDAVENLTFMKASPSPQKPAPGFSRMASAPTLVSVDSSPAARSPDRIIPPSSLPTPTSTDGDSENEGGSSNALMLAAMAMTALQKDSPAKASTSASPGRSDRSAALVYAERTSDTSYGRSADSDVYSQVVPRKVVGAARSDQPPIKKRRVVGYMCTKGTGRASRDPVGPTPVGSRVASFTENRGTGASFDTTTSRVSTDEGEGGSTPTNSSKADGTRYTDIASVHTVKRGDHENEGGTVTEGTVEPGPDSNQTEILAG